MIGICAGYQMLGERLLDPDAVESRVAETPGLALLPATTTFRPDKATHQVTAKVAGSQGLLSRCGGASVVAYEIHMGVTSAAGSSSPFVVQEQSGQRVDYRDGAMDAEGLTLGTYLHGLFHNRELRRSILACAGARRGLSLPAAHADIEPNVQYDKLASLVREHLDMGLIYGMTGLER